MLLATDKTAVMLGKSLKAASLRYEVIADNIANIDTPGFKKSFVVFEDILRETLEGRDSSSLRKTHPNHFGNTDSFEGIQPEVKKDDQTSLRLDGNNVDIEEEMTQLVMNTVNYNFTAQQINNKLAMLRYVITEGR